MRSMEIKKKVVVGILAHVDSGKTTLTESLLFEAGVIDKQGRVDNKDAFLDNDAIERERGITIYSKNARFVSNGTEFILVDTPGHVDFSSETERALGILDAAILLISASSGIQSHTKTLWSLLKRYGIPTYIFVNKTDMEGVDETRLLKLIKEKLSDSAVSFENPKSEQTKEEIAGCDEELMNAYFATGTVDDDAVKKAIKERKIFPVFFGSALKMRGIHEFYETLTDYMIETDFDKDTDFSAVVYKIHKSEDKKRLTFLKILSGRLQVKDVIEDEKVNEIRIYSGEKYQTVTVAVAGDICAVVGLSKSRNGSMYGNVPRPLNPALAPAISYAIKYSDDVDKTVMLGIMRELEEEDPSYDVEYKEQTGEIFVSLMGDIQAEVLQRVLNDRYGIKVSFNDGKVCYKETITSCVEGVGHFEPLRHYAEVHIKIEPLERNSGIEYVLDVSEDLLARNWQRLILTHLKEREHKGVLQGAPLTDVRYTLVAGKAHIKHTEGGDFRQATYRAIRQGLMELRANDSTVLLEPFYNYSLSLPSEYTGRAMTDISSMYGTVSVSENDCEDNLTVLVGRAPAVCMNGYSKEVSAYTKGMGQLSCVPGGYDVCHNTEEVLSSSSYDPESDMKNPCGSVFCSHGAGTVIPWNEVPEYMHIPYSYDEQDTESDEYVYIPKNSVGENERLISIDEIEEILRKSTHANEKGRQNSYKGISKELRDRRRYEAGSRTDGNSVKYVGAAHKEKYILVDGYNVIHAWQELEDIAKVSFDGAVGRLNDILANYSAIEGVKLMAVYDAYKVKGHQIEESEYNGIVIVYTKEAQTADRYIEHYTHENSKKYDITVITSDGMEQTIVIGNGGNVISSRKFKELLEDKVRKFNEDYNVK